MIRRLIALVLLAFAPAVQAEKQVPADLVDVQAYVPDLVIDLRYATPNNFMGRAVYPPDARCLLRRSVAERLKRVADKLRAEDGTRLRAYDCYRPLSVQKIMWSIFPKPGYVANPKGGSVHNRGAAIDLTLASPGGEELPMPTGFDTFSKKAWHSYAGATPEQARNRARLLHAMEAEGFKRNPMEWWHYEAPDKKAWPVLDVPFDAIPKASEAKQDG